MKGTCVLLAALLALASCGSRTSLPAEVERGLSRLDDALEKKAGYDARKEDVIASKRTAWLRAANDAERYSRAYDLWLEYSSYQYDSTYAYALRMQDAARRTGDRSQLAGAACARIDCLVSAGLYKEAFDAASEVDTVGLAQPALLEYYKTMLRLNFFAANYTQTEPWTFKYRADGARYSRLLLDMAPKNSSVWKQINANLLMENTSYEDGVEAFRVLLDDPSEDLHQRAIYASSMGWMLSCLGREDEAILAVAESAMCDLQSSTKETTALRMLAEMLSRRGEIERPVRYVRHSLDDANFYGTRLRKLEVGAVLPLVERNYNESLGRERNLLMLVLILALLLFSAALSGFWIIRRQNNRLKEARSIIEERNEALEAINLRLAEVSAIKDEYIGNTFYLNSEYIDRLSEFQKTVDRMLVTGQYELLRRSLKESTLAKERDRMYDAFDATFLRIFPTFINDYNALFPESERQYPSSGLNTEMRIFALIRLGISGSERIARFLDYSVHTINTYKTRVKNRSLVDNEQFEEEIMQIGRG
ncbi:MAG: helix-turn-helix transcriptional regulator [Bacteroidales bacterium]|nr:helix-turn-helix transcriptional regulator [Bacteroidales bacterium]